ncbi:DUF2089 family protein [Anaerophaga thermohalophila]|uniref:DUF2089 family protein n=1 Tax=Anaerophaga thermohalophila TaxID=177400 RepID=UPI001C400C07
MPAKPTITGSFSLPVFLKLTPKEQEFIMTFVRNSGSLKQMSKALKLSYPTVRNMLDDLIEKLNRLNSNSGQPFVRIPHIQAKKTSFKKRMFFAEREGFEPPDP